MRRSLLLSVVAVSLLAAAVPAAQARPSQEGRYIVVLDDSVSSPGGVAAAHSRDHSARVDHVYSSALKGYSAAMSETAAARILNDPRVSYVESDGVATKALTEQTGATWGLDRIDQRDLPLNGKYGYTRTGANVTAYVIDSGITSHPDFASRLSPGGVDFVDGGAPTDCDGHGTHVAGTIGGSLYGVAKGVTLVGVRVLDCNGDGYWSDVIAGVDWVTADHDAGESAVANMSLGGGAISSVDDAITRSISDGVTYAVAAGNGNKAGQGQDACNYSPARTPNALTVGATSSSDAKATFSNYGTCVDLFAPGVGITSTTMNGLTESWNGTSMATPHVAGVAALYLESNPAASAASVAEAIRSSATPGKVTSAGTGSPNRLLFSLVTTPVVTEPPPSSDPSPITLTASGRKVKGVMNVTVTWSGATGTQVDLYRNGTPIATPNDGTHSESFGKGGGTFTYKVCETGSSTRCSNEATVVF